MAAPHPAAPRCWAVGLRPPWAGPRHQWRATERPMARAGGVCRAQEAFSLCSQPGRREMAPVHSAGFRRWAEVRGPPWAGSHLAGIPQRGTAQAAAQVGQGHCCQPHGSEGLLLPEELAWVASPRLGRPPASSSLRRCPRSCACSETPPTFAGQPRRGPPLTWPLTMAHPWPPTQMHSAFHFNHINVHMHHRMGSSLRRLSISGKAHLALYTL